MESCSLVLAGSEGGEAGVRDRRFRKLKTMTEAQSAGYQVFLVISPRPAPLQDSVSHRVLLGAFSPDWSRWLSTFYPM